MIIIFLVGVIVGGLINYSVISNQVENHNDQINFTDNKNDTVEKQDIFYFINDTSLSKIYEDVIESIVVIYGYVEQTSFFTTQYSQVQGSGFVYEHLDNIVIITNNHVVNDAVDITVSFSNGNTYPAEVIGTDAYSDLAILSVDAPDYEFHPLEITSSSNLNVGDPVVAIGSPYGLGGSMTSGIISQLDRTIGESLVGNFLISNIIQISAAINPGNSGGPMFNYQGQVIGITTAILADSEGLGFAIPSNTILREIDSLIKNGSYNKHSLLGVSGIDMNYYIAENIGSDYTYGWMLASVTEGSGAGEAGLKGGDQQISIYDEWVVIGGDIIIAIDGTQILNGDNLMSYLAEYTTPNQLITITIVRDNELYDIPVVLGTRPIIN